MSEGRQCRAKIVATLGPASSSVEIIRALVEAGADVFRLNFSHGSHDEHRARYDIIRADRAGDRPADRRAGRPARAQAAGRARWRGADGAGRGRPGALRPRPDAGRAASGCRCRTRRCSRPWRRACSCWSTTARSGSRSRQAGARHGHRAGRWSAARCPTARGVSVVGAVLPVSALTEKDRVDLAFAVQLGVDWVALSFVQRPEDLDEVRALAGPAGLAGGQAREAGGGRAAGRDRGPLGRGDGGARRSRASRWRRSRCRRSSAGSCAPAGRRASR